MGKPFTRQRHPLRPVQDAIASWSTSTPPRRRWPGVSKVSAIKRSSDVIEYKEGGNAIIRKGLGRTKYDPITLERGVTHDDSTSSSGPTPPRCWTRARPARR